MRLRFHHIRNHEQRAAAAARIVAIGLERNLAHVAFDAAQAAARAGLLAWGRMPQRSFAHRDVAILVDIAAAQRSDFVARPLERLRLARELLSVMPRIFPPRMMASSDPAWRIPARHAAAPAPGPWHAFRGDMLDPGRSPRR